MRNCNTRNRKCCRSVYVDQLPAGVFSVSMSVQSKLSVFKHFIEKLYLFIIFESLFLIKLFECFLIYVVIGF